MDRSVSNLLSTSKNVTNKGTTEENPFILSLKDKEEFSKLHAYGFHCVPHIGVYGEMYSPCLPMVLISLPVYKSLIARQLPNSITELLFPDCMSVATKRAITVQPRPANVGTPLLNSSPERKTCCGQCCASLCYVLTIPCHLINCLLHKSFQLDQSQETDSSQMSHLPVKRYASGGRGPESPPPKDVTDFVLDDSTELFIIFHPHPEESPCQKFICENTDEFNLMYHAWLYRDAPYEQSYSMALQLQMGVFEAKGVKPVHQDLKDAGISFGRLEERTVCIHDCRFSPENAMMQKTHKMDLITFFSVAKQQNQKVVAYHVVCATEEIEQKLRELLPSSNTLGKLFESLGKHKEFSDVLATVQRMILPLADVPNFN